MPVRLIIVIPTLREAPESIIVTLQHVVVILIRMLGFSTRV